MNNDEYDESHNRREKRKFDNKWKNIYTMKINDKPEGDE